MSELNVRIAQAKGLHVAAWTDGTGAIHVHTDKSRNTFKRDWQHSIADAWELAMEMQAGRLCFVLSPAYDVNGPDGWVVQFSDGERHEADSECEVLCLAYLAIHEGNDDE